MIKRWFICFLTASLFMLALVGCTPNETPPSEQSSAPAASESTDQKEEELPVEKDGFRLIFVSDLHYTALPHGNSDSNNTYGMDADERAQFFVDTMLSEKEKHPTKELFVFLLGDLTSSEFNYQLFDPAHANYAGDKDMYDLNEDGEVDLSDYYGSEYDPISLLKTKYLDQLTENGVQIYCIPGNHDTYSNAEWSALFDYANDGYVSFYDEDDAEYAVEIDETTAVLLLNAYNENRGSMTGSRDGSGKSFLAGTQQTLSYTESELSRIEARLDQLRARGFQNVYIASHYTVPEDKTVKALAEKYGDLLKGIFMGDEHTDREKTMFGLPAYVNGHFSVGMMKNPTTGVDMDHAYLPVSYISVETENGQATVDYHKVERLYLGVDNYEYLSRYFTLTRDEPLTAADDKKGENIVGLTEPLFSPDGKKDFSALYFYRYTLRAELSDGDRATGERLKYYLDTYNMGIRLMYTYGSDLVYNYSYINYSFKHLENSFFQQEEIYKTSHHPFVTEAVE